MMTGALLIVWGIIATLLTVIFLFDDMKRRLIIKNTDRELCNLKEELQKLNRAQIQPQVESKTENILNGYVRREEHNVSGRTVISLSITDKVPHFQTIGQATIFAMNLLEPMTDPTVMNLTGYGNVARTEDFLAFKMILKEVIKQIAALDNNDTKEIVD